MTTDVAGSDLDRRQCPTTRRGGGGTLYVIEIGTDRIKVGWSRNPKVRLTSHRTAAAAHGVGSGREWASPPHAKGDAEAELITFCKARAVAQVAYEYFVGVAFEDARQRAAELTKYTADELQRLVCAGSPNAKWSVPAVARLLSTTEEAVRDLVLRGDLAPRYPDDDFDQFPETSRRALVNWFATDPDLLALPRSA